MLKIGEFSKLSHLTVKALRYYEKEGILMPASIDKWTGYRYYETSQLMDAANIKAYRQLDLSVEEIKEIRAGKDLRLILGAKMESLAEEKKHIDAVISSIHHLLEDSIMQYQVTEKIVPQTLVYTAETVVSKFSDILEWIPAVGEECAQLNPDLKCVEPSYEFCEYPDWEFTEQDIRVRHNEAVLSRGRENDHIKFREIPETKVLSVLHQGPYDTLSEAYAFLMNYAEKNGYTPTGLTRECYIDGIWNKDSEEEWLTEIQLPVK